MVNKIGKRNEIIKHKEQEKLRLALLKKKQEAMLHQKRRDVRESLTARMLIKNELELERSLARDESIQKQKQQRLITNAKIQQRKNYSSLSM